MAVIARDPDAGGNGTVRYKMADNQPTDSNANYFRIQEADGQIYTNTDPANLDRSVLLTPNYVLS